MQTNGFHGAFNARWVTPEQVARQFVPIPQFLRLVHSANSVLLGPRGSGKTTLLKMLSDRALRVWRQERAAKYQLPPFEYPQFHAVYIPSDVRWSYEISDLETDPSLSPHQAQLVQRAMVTASVLTALTDTFDALISGRAEFETNICRALIQQWELPDTAPQFWDIRASIMRIVHHIRGMVNLGGDDLLEQLRAKLPTFFFAHAVDTSVAACRIVGDVAPGCLRFDRWALCFDELEIAPEWLRREVLESLRSVDQQFLLKLTWSPVLPSARTSSPAPSEDYTPIRLWHSHVQDARAFCDDLARQFLETAFPDQEVTPDDFFTHSELARDDNSPGELRSYRRGSQFYRQMQALAKIDPSFESLLKSHDIDPADPYTDSIPLRDTFLRKVKPVVLLRIAFLKEERRRSRKVFVAAYAGKQAVYAMSEGNPRWLLGLLTELKDRWMSCPRIGKDGRPRMLRFADQARALNSAARKFETILGSTAVVSSQKHHQPQSLLDFLRPIGKAMEQQILGRDFPVDPFGSFYVDGSPNTRIVQTVTRALEMGALVYVGQADDDVPVQIAGGRFRLTFMLSPVFRLPFRNYRAVSLSSLLKRTRKGDQPHLFTAKGV
jgi:hypothetical protein